MYMKIHGNKCTLEYNVSQLFLLNLASLKPHNSLHNGLNISIEMFEWESRDKMHVLLIRTAQCTSISFQWNNDRQIFRSKSSIQSVPIRQGLSQGTGEELSSSL